MRHDILDDHNRVVDDQSNRSRQSAERHQIEAFPDGPHEKDGDRNGYGNDQAGNQGRSPVAEEKKQNDACQNQPDQDRVTNAANAFAHQLGLIVIGFELYACRQGLSELLNLRGDGVGDGYGIARRLTGNVQQNRGMIICGNRCVNRQHSGLHLGYIGDTNRHSARCRLHHQMAKLIGIMRLRPHETENQLMICFVEPRRIDDVRRLYGVDEVEYGHARGLHPRHVRNNMELRHLATLHRYRAYARDAV